MRGRREGQSQEELVRRDNEGQSLGELVRGRHEVSSWGQLRGTVVRRAREGQE